MPKTKEHLKPSLNFTGSYKKKKESIGSISSVVGAGSLEYIFGAKYGS